MRRVKIRIGDQTALATLLEKDAPWTCDTIWNALPVRGELHHAKFAGEEVMFIVPLVFSPQGEEKQTPIAAVEPGSILYWPNRQLIAIFYGPTQQGEEKGEEGTVFCKVIQNLQGLSEECKKVMYKQGKSTVIRRAKS